MNNRRTNWCYKNPRMNHKKQSISPERVAVLFNKEWIKEKKTTNPSKRRGREGWATLKNKPSSIKAGVCDKRRAQLQEKAGSKRVSFIRSKCNQLQEEAHKSREGLHYWRQSILRGIPFLNCLLLMHGAFPRPAFNRWMATSDRWNECWWEEELLVLSLLHIKVVRPEPEV